MDSFPLTTCLDAEVTVLDEVDSTNRFLRDSPAEGDRLAVAITTHQTAGRGRQERVWVTPPGRGLALSIALPASILPPVTPRWIQALALVAGTAVAEAVAEEVTDHVGVKWPNDVLVSGKKVAGILGEVTPDGRVIVGIGINLDVPPEQLPVPHATSLHLYGVETAGLADRLCHDIVTRLMGDVLRMSNGLDEEMTKRVTARLDTIGRQVRVDFPDGESLFGVARELTSDGALIVQGDGEGGDTIVTAADVWHVRHHESL